MAPRSREDKNQISFLDNLEKAPSTEKVKITAPPVETPQEAPKVWSVSELSKDLRENLRARYQQISLRGEICDFKGIHRSGHLYMGLKDESSQIRVVVWKGVVQKVPFDLKMGLEVIVIGSIDYYGAGGSLQIVAERIEPLGMGALQLKFEQLKEKLQKEGLFALERKKVIPAHATRIGLVTGKSTAALQDMLRIFAQKYPLAEILLFHAAVQGENAPREIISAIGNAERYARETKPIDVLIIGRGGGSYEDLFCFNDEKLVRKISSCSIPTISAVGHEIDFTLADFVADKSAATPTHAASESVPDIRVINNDFNTCLHTLEQHLNDKIKDYSQKIDLLWNQILSRAPHQKLKAQKQLLEQYMARVVQSMQMKIDSSKAELKRYASFLDAISPLKVLERGFSLVQNEAGKFVRNSDSVKIGETLSVKLLQGTLKVSVKETKAP
ncbi:MAG: exodeoxyribonuclease VII large subunit [Bdellovibrionota bacterium]